EPIGFRIPLAQLGRSRLRKQAHQPAAAALGDVEFTIGGPVEPVRGPEARTKSGTAADRANRWLVCGNTRGSIAPDRRSLGLSCLQDLEVLKRRAFCPAIRFAMHGSGLIDTQCSRKWKAQSTAMVRRLQCGGGLSHAGAQAPECSDEEMTPRLTPDN